MPTTLDDEYGVPDAENPELTKEDFARALRFDQLPEHIQAVLKAPTRGPQKAPTKIMTAIRLSPDVLEALRGTGRGWQSRVDETLRKVFVTEATQSQK